MMVNKEKATDVIYLNFSKAFDKVPYNVLLSELKTYGFNMWAVQWKKNSQLLPRAWCQRLNVQMEISGKLCTSGVSAGTDAL